MMIPNIKKHSNTIPKIFKMFSFFLIVTLCSFFGCIEFFKPTAPPLIPQNPSDAQETTPFQKFVTAMMEFENIDTNFRLGINNKDLGLFADGNLAYDLNKGLSLNVDLIYNEQSFNVDAKFLSPFLYLTITPNNSTAEILTYKFDMTANQESGEIDFSSLIDFIMKNLNLDLSFFNKYLDFIGVDLNNLDLDSLIKKQEERQDGSYEFVLGLGNLNIQIICDEDFNIKKVTLRDAIIEGTALTFNANVNHMNSDKVEIEYEESGEEIDLSGLTTNVGYIQNLYKNNFVNAYLNLDLNGKKYDALLCVDTLNSKVKLNTIVENFDIEIAYANEIIFVEVEGLKFKCKLEDFALWKEKIDKILKEHANNSVEEFVGNLILKFTGFDISNKQNIQQSLMTILGLSFNSIENVLEVLPTEIFESENREKYQVVWKNGGSVLFEQKEQITKSIHAKFGQTSFDVNFEIVESGFDVIDEHFDLVNLAPLTEIVDKILQTKQFGGEIALNINEYLVEANYSLNFENGILAELKTQILGENVEVFIQENKILFKVGEIVVEGDVNALDVYQERISKIFGINLNVPDFKENLVQINELCLKLREILQNLSLSSEVGYLAIVSTLSTMASISIEGDVAVVKFEKENLKGVMTVGATTNNILIPSDAVSVFEIFDKIESLKKYVDEKIYAFQLNLKCENIELSGNVSIDLNRNIFDLSNLILGGNELNLRMQNNFLYVDYAGNKFKIELTSTEQIVAIISNIILSNAGYGTMPLNQANDESLEQEIDMFKDLLLKIFGEDISSLSLNELLSKMNVSIFGDLTTLETKIELGTEKPFVCNVEINFVEDMLNSVNMSIQENVFIELLLMDFNIGEIDEMEYYDLMSEQRGSLTVQYTVNEKLSDGSFKPAILEFKADIEISLKEHLYVKISTKILEEEIEIIIIDNILNIQIGDVVLRTDFCDVRELYEYIVEIFDVSLNLNNNLDFEQLLKNIDLNALDLLNVQGLKWEINSQQINLSYTNETNLKLNLVLDDEQEIEIATLPEESEDLKETITKIRNTKEYFETGVYEFDFELVLNGLSLNGIFKYFEGNLEISNMLVCGENLDIRIHKNVLYMSYGNMKIKFALPVNGGGNPIDLLDIISKITSENFKFDLQFGVFGEIIDILQNETLEDLFTKYVLDLTGTTDALKLSISHKKEFSLNEILKMNINFEENSLKNLNIQIYDNIFANIKIHSTKISTISEFNPEDYSDYADDYADGLMNSLRVEPDVYAFSSDIAIRYSNNSFYGQLTAMLVENPLYNGILGSYVPAISLYTTSLGLSSYVYLIDDCIYIDINGLQISADLTKTTIDEIMAFVEKNFASLLQSSQAKPDSDVSVLAAGAEVFKVILPSLDKIYGSWVQLTQGENEYNGIQFAINDSLWYSPTSYFNDIIAQIFISNYENTIVPVEVILGANIHDPNTEVYDDYSQYWLKDGETVLEEPITKTLNFAVYLNNFTVGKDLQGLNNIFIGNNGDFKELVSVKTNVGETKLSDFNSYEIVIDFVEATYSYFEDMHFDLNLNATIESQKLDANNVQTNTQTRVSGDVLMSVADLPENNNIGTEDEFGLFNGKKLNVQGNGLTFELKEMKNGVFEVQSKHILDLLYGSDKDGLYVTYTHSNYADDTSKTDNGNNNIESGDSLRARIANVNMSKIISLILGFVNVQPNENIMQSWHLEENTTDFSFIHQLMGLDVSDNEDTITKVDGLLSSVNGLTKLLNSIKLQKVENKDEQGINIGLSQIVLTLEVDLSSLSINENEQNKTTQIQLIVEQNRGNAGEVVNKLSKLCVNNLLIGENLINLEINFKDYNYHKIIYGNDGKTIISDGNFDYDINAEHIDFSEISSFVESVVNTTNQRSFNFAGTLKADLSIVTLDIALDVLVSIDEKKNVYAYVQFITTSSALGKLAFDSWSFDKRISILEYKSGQILLSQYDLKGNKVTKNNIAKDIYNINQINSDDLVNMIKDLFGFNKSVFDIIVKIIKNLDIHPTVEKAILDYQKTSTGYVLKVNGANLLGDSSAKDMEFVFGTKKVNGEYCKFVESDNGNGTQLIKTPKVYEFIDSISTVMSLSGITLTLNLGSVEGDSYSLWQKAFDGASYDSITGDAFPEKVLFTNSHYRELVAHQIYAIYFEENGGVDIEDIYQNMGELVALPHLDDKVTYEFDVLTKTTWSFDGWWSSETFKEGTRVENVTMPKNGMTLYAKWNVKQVEKLYQINLIHNGQIVSTLYRLAGETVSLSDFVYSNITNRTSYFMDENFLNECVQSTFTVAQSGFNIYMRNRYTITFDILDDDVSLNLSPWKGNAKLYYKGQETSQMSYEFFEGEVNLNDFVARCKYKVWPIYYYYVFQGWKGTVDGIYNLTNDVTIEASFSKLQTGESGYNQN